MDTPWLTALATALQEEDEVRLLERARALLGDGARLATWSPTAAGWTHAHGDEIALPGELPHGSTTVGDGEVFAVRVGSDPTASRMLALAAPALDHATAAAVAELLRVALGRLVERRTAASIRQRLADNERIGQLGSYDWHVATDSNRWSDQLYRIYGEAPQSFNATYERFIEFIHPDDRDRVRAIHQRAFETGEPYEMEERIVLADGTERLLWSNGEVMMGPDGSPERFIGICRDVTDQRAAEEAAAAAEHHRQRAHDAEIRRRAALELNDVVVQGLTAAAWAGEVGAQEVARSVLEETLESARAMMDDLLVGEDGPPGAGELRRTTAPEAHIHTELPPQDRPDRGDGTTRRRVVLADDAPDVRLLLSVQLDLMGLEVVGEASTGREAVDLVDQHLPDIVLLDLSMPEMDGLEAATRIRADHPEAVIVVVSGYAATTMAQPAAAAGADAYIEKGHDLAARLAPVLGAVV